jgi:hypothetical protein
MPYSARALSENVSRAFSFSFLKKKRVGHSQSGLFSLPGSPTSHASPLSLTDAKEYGQGHGSALHNVLIYGIIGVIVPRKVTLLGSLSHISCIGLCSG